MHLASNRSIKNRLLLVLCKPIHMKKITLLLLFIVMFTASFGSFGDVNCAGDTTKVSAFDCASECESNQSSTGAEHSHCASHCGHSLNAFIPNVTIKLQIEVLTEINSNYLFAYTSPTLDSIERPPLAS